MGLSSMMQGGLEAVGGTMAKIGTEELLMQQRAEIEALRDARLQELKLEFDATTRSRNVADAETERQRVETAATGIAEGKTGLIAERAGLNDADYRGDEGVGVPVQKGQAVPTSRDRMQAQGKHAELAQLEERDKAQEIAGERQKSDDEKWRMTHAETVRFHDASIKHQAAQLGLKDKDAKDFNAAVDSYVESKADLAAMVAGNHAENETLAKARQDVERAALKLKQWKVDPSDTSDFAKRLNLSATLTALNKTIEDVSTDPATVEKAKAARASIIEQMATITSGGNGAAAATGGGVLPPLADRVVGQIYDTPKGKMEWLGGGKWRAAKPQQQAGIEATLLHPQYGKGGMIQVREKL